MLLILLQSKSDEKSSVF